MANRSPSQLMSMEPLSKEPAKTQKRDMVTFSVHESPHAKLLVLAAEVGGRWNHTTVHFVRQLAKHKVRTAPMVLQRSADLAWADRWWTLLGVAVQDALAASWPCD